MSPEFTEVEHPFITQLQAQGWAYIQGDVFNPATTLRTHFAEVIQESVLRQKLRELNLRNPNEMAGASGAASAAEPVPWLDDERLSEAVTAITRIARSRLMEANQLATELLLLGVTVTGEPGWHGGRGQTIRFIDWDTPENNQFTVINQYRVDCPPGHGGAERDTSIVPDLVLLVNGIPLVVVECKNPAMPEPLAEAINQLRRYSNQRFPNHEVAENEGCPPLFFTTQLLIATHFDQARVGSIGSMAQHFVPWKTVIPADEAALAASLGVEKLSEQQRLVAGMLTPANLLDLVRHYTLFMQVGGQTIKTVCRYQQFRAVSLAINRLKTGNTRLQDGEMDRRGGVIWHTQGSGKSLTMVFLVRKLRTDPQLRHFKVVVITDRKDLQKQLSATATLTGEGVEVAGNMAAVQKIVSRKGPGLVFATIQKYRDPDSEGEPGLTAEDMPAAWRKGQYPIRQDLAGYDVKPAKTEFPVLNDDESILVLVDEAHRTQSGPLHTNLQAGLPNCVRIGFTGTPIMMGDKKRTAAIFGPQIDRYDIREAERDGAIVPVLYEGRTASGAIRDGADLDQLFEDMFQSHSAAELEAIKQKYATKGPVLEATELIKEKALDMLRHYVTHVLPEGHKAQVVAASRRAVVRYVDALGEARTQLLAQAAALSPADKALEPEELCLRPPKVRALIQAWRYRDRLQAIEFAAVISGGANDDASWRAWTEPAANENRIARFKKTLPGPAIAPANGDALAFLVVKSMLLTGFDAPIEGVMYLDRPIREAELLQAVARVNRTGFGKQYGLIVDYYGVAQHLKEALDTYAADEIEGALQSLRDQLPALRDCHQRVLALFHQRGIDTLSDNESCVSLLQDERLRAEFTVKLKHFLAALNMVLPRPEGLPFIRDAKDLSFIYARARNRYRDTPVLGQDVGARVRHLIDEHVISLGIDPKIPPISLTDVEFEAHLTRQPNQRAKASEMEHAIRFHIRKHFDQDPVLYQRLSERLAQILATLDGQWRAMIAAFQQVIADMLAGRSDADKPLPDLPQHCIPFFHTLEDAVAGGDISTLNQEQAKKLLEVTVKVVELIRAELTDTFWEPNRLTDQEDLSSKIFECLYYANLAPFDQARALADTLRAQARASHNTLYQP